MSEPSSSPWTDLLSNLSLRRLRSKASLRSTLSKKKEQPPSIGSRNSSYISYAVYQQTMHPTILKDQDATKKLLDSILDTPGGKRSVSRLARTCKAFREPALDALWRDLDSLIPIIGLFPSNLLKKSRKPGLGLTKTPVAEDWNKILVYGERVRRITYDESANNVAASILSVIHHHQPKRILPNLLHLTWKAETPAGLEHCSLFVNDELEGLVLEINTRLPQLNALFTDVCERTRLTAFSFTSPTNLPDSFIDVLSPQVNLQKLVLVAPGALSSKVGQWAAELPALRNFQLDLTGRSVIAVEGFFEDIRPRSGASTPASVRSRDSGVFSSDELDFSEIRKSSLRLTGDLQSKGSFHHLRQLHLTGEVSNISVFLKHLQCPLRSIDLVIEDPPDQADWQELSAMISERFGKSLQSLRITATGSSRFTDLVRSTSRMEPPMKHLSLAYFTSLPRLIRFEVDLPESNIFHNSDMEHLAHACPNVEILRLCPVARFPTGAPNLTLEGIAPLIEGCHRLHTLAIVVNAKGGKAEVLESRATSSRSLLRLHVGHSWVHDPLQVTILLSHLAPYLETLRWFHEKNRPGFIEANARGWQTVSEYLPLLQNLRLSERAAAIPVPVPSSHLPPVPAIQDAPAAPETAEKSVDATVATMDRAVYASPRVAEAAVQVMPQTTSRMVEARPEMFSVSIDATPSLADVGVYTMVHTSEKSVDATPLTASVGVDALIAIEHADRKGNGLAFESMELSDGESTADNAWGHSYVIWPSVYSLLSSACKAFISFPLYVPMRILHFSLSTLHAHRAGETTQDTETKHHALSEPSSPSFMSQSDVAIPPEIPEFTCVNNKTDIQPESVIPCKESKLSTVVAVEETAWLRSVQINVNNLTGTRQFTIPSGLTDAQRVPYHPSYTSVMTDTRKQEKDYAPEVDALLPEATSLAQSGRLTEALDKILTLEKHTRNASDLASTTRLVKAAIERCYEARDYALLNSNISILSKKHGQLKGAVQAIVELSMTWLEEIRTREGVEKWLELVETLRSVTEGKIFLETPRARVTLLLSHYHESLANSATTPTAQSRESLQTGSDLLSELQVETYSSMERREKTEFILEQMRLLIAVARQKDADKSGKDAALGGGEAEWVKVRVGGRKVNETFLTEKANEDLKLKYYDLMIQHALQQSSYLDVAKYYYKVWETPTIKEDVNDKGKAALEHIVYYVVLAPHDNEQSDTLHHLFADPALLKLDLHYNLVKCFVTRELNRWPGIVELYGPFLRTTAVFSSDQRWEDLHTRVIEHNIRVVAQYYTRITLPRLTSLLDLTALQTEDTLARLVVNGTIWARVDRPAGIVNFRSKRSAEDVMNDWSSDMQKLLGLVEKTWMGVNAAQAAQSRVKA